MRRFALVAAAAIAGLAFLSAHGNTQTAGTPPASGASDAYQQLSLFSQVFEKMRSDHVEEVSDETLVEGAIDGRLTPLACADADQHTKDADAEEPQIGRGRNELSEQRGGDADRQADRRNERGR